MRRWLPLWRLWLRLARLRRLRLLLVMGTLPHLLRALLQSPGAVTAAGLRQGTPSATFIAPIVADWVRQAGSISKNERPNGERQMPLAKAGLWRSQN